MLELVPLVVYHDPHTNARNQFLEIVEELEMVTKFEEGLNRAKRALYHLSYIHILHRNNVKLNNMKNSYFVLSLLCVLSTTEIYVGMNSLYPINLPPYQGSVTPKWGEIQVFYSAESLHVWNSKLCLYS